MRKVRTSAASTAVWLRAILPPGTTTFGVALLGAMVVGLTLQAGSAHAQTYETTPPPPVLGPDYGRPLPPPRFGLFGPRYGYGPRAETLARFCATDAGTCTMGQLQPIASPCRCIIDGRRFRGDAVH